jgi:hypothetical protein
MNKIKSSKKVSEFPVGGKSSDKEKGVALLFTLGFLALLLVLALAFATTSITQKKMAGNNNDTTYAKMLAESALQRVIGVLQSYDEGAQYSHCDSTTHSAEPPKNRGGNTGPLDCLYKLGTANAFYWYDSYATPPNINWEYIKQYDSDAKTNKITGRVAYVVIPGGGLDPVKLVKSQINENGFLEVRKGVEVNEINVKSLDNASPSILSTAQAVTNFSYNETNPTFPLTINGRLVPVSPPVSQNGTWTDFENMFSLMNITDSSKKNTIRDWFVLNTQPEAEAFWRDNLLPSSTLGNSKIDFNLLYPSTINPTVDELFHRFNLVRFTDNSIPLNGVYDSGTDANLWDSIILKDIIPNIMKLTDVTVVSWPAIADVYVQPSTSYDGRCIPWIENWKDAGTFTDPDGAGVGLTAANVRAKQIAANLIDYCDTTSIPTTDWDRVTPITPALCTYMGLERTPYINEISVGIKATVTTEVSADKKIHIDIYSSVGGELINMYGDNFGAATLTIAGNVTGIIGFDSAVVDTSGADLTVVNASGNPLFGTRAFSGTTGSITLSTHPYLYGSSTETKIYSFTSDEIGLAQNARVNFTAVKVQVTSATLTFGGHVVDVAFPDAFPDTAVASDWSIPTNIKTNLNSSSWDKRGWFAYQVDDPRQNHNNADWPQANSKAVSATTVDYEGTSLGSPGLVSNSYNGVNLTMVTISTAGKDTETVTDPAYINATQNISTAYIRNDIMQSPWELGAIHRGAKWETINLIKFNSTEGVLATGGGNAYAGGDANILDQIKMTQNTTSDKKLNLKLHKDSVLYSLFHKVKLGQDYATFSGGTDLTSAKIWNFASASPDSTTLVYQLKEKNINFYSRGCLAEVSRLSDGTCFTPQSNDRQKEEIIGKVINLTGVSASDYFTIIVLAQTIKDIGGGITISKDLDMNGTIGTASELVLHSDINGNNNATDPSISETITSCVFGAYDQYADEILAEQKIKVELYREPATKIIKILRYEYIEE